jgi:hypothetical protein
MQNACGTNQGNKPPTYRAQKGSPRHKPSTLIEHKLPGQEPSTLVEYKLSGHKPSTLVCMDLTTNHLTILDDSNINHKDNHDNIRINTT